MTNPVFYSFVTYHQILNKDKTTGATGGTVYLSAKYEFTPVISWSVLLNL
jgi:hypothetical protein